MAVTRQDVIDGFRWLLGREPESEETIAAHLAAEDVTALRRALIRSDEFRHACSTKEPGTRLLLLTTTMALWVLDPATGCAWQINTGRGVYYGLSFDEERIYVACREASYLGDKESENNAILCLDRNLRVVDTLRPPRPIRDVHQIFCHRGILYVCATYEDAVFACRLATGKWEVWHPFGEDEAAACDQHHVNSILVRDDLLLLAGTKPGGWFARFDPRRQPLDGGKRPLGSDTHNVWLEGEEVFVCSSSEGAMLSSAGARRAIRSRAWLRGISRIEDRVFLGVTQELVNLGRDDFGLLDHRARRDGPRRALLRASRLRHDP